MKYENLGRVQLACKITWKIYYYRCNANTNAQSFWLQTNRVSSNKVQYYYFQIIIFLRNINTIQKKYLLNIYTTTYSF